MVTDSIIINLLPFNVLIGRSSTGAATDFDGSFSINVDKGDILVFSLLVIQL